MNSSPISLIRRVHLLAVLTLAAALLTAAFNSTSAASHAGRLFGGASHTASGSCVGVGGDGTLSGLDLSGTTHTNAGSYNDPWTFTDSTGNYNNAGGSVNDNIAKANATINVTGYTGYYDGSAHGTTEKTSVSDVRGFFVTPVSCLAGVDIADDQTLMTTGGTSFRYSGTPGIDGQFIQSWATPSGAGKCYKVTMTALDNSTLSAFFKTK